MGPEPEAGKGGGGGIDFREQCCQVPGTMSYGYFRGASGTNGGLYVRGDYDVGCTGPVMGVA